MHKNTEDQKGSYFIFPKVSFCFQQKSFVLTGRVLAVILSSAGMLIMSPHGYHTYAPVAMGSGVLGPLHACVREWERNP